MCLFVWYASFRSFVVLLHQGTKTAHNINTQHINKQQSNGTTRIYTHKQQQGLFFAEAMGTANTIIIIISSSSSSSIIMITTTTTTITTTTNNNNDNDNANK